MKKLLASLRFLLMFLAIILVFGLGGSLILAAFDKEQTQSTAPLWNLGTIWNGVTHFIQQLFEVAFTGTNHYNVPFHNFFLLGLATTIEYCFIAMPLALICGFIIALMSDAKAWIIRAPARAFVEFIRNTPLLVQMLIIYNGFVFLPQWLNNPFTAGIATLTINYAAYEAENLRAGLAAIDKGQNEASMTLGLSRGQTLRLVLVPQVIPISLPTVINDFIYMFKDSSILSLITVVELTVQTQGLVRLFEVNTWQFYTIAAILYLALSLPLGRLARYLEEQLRGHSFAQGRDLTSLTLFSLAGVLLVGVVMGLLASEAYWATFGAPVELLAGILFILALVIAVMLILGLPVYLIGLLVGAARSGKARAPQPHVVATSVGKL